ncbi:MAG: hypothetical protein N2749_07175 [Clostridia bacterium]|nr:hypothetical protein [Clostridia bacterium]
MKKIEKLSIKYSEIILTILSLIISYIILNYISIDIQKKDSLLNSIITVSGVLPGLLLSFLGILTNLPDDNKFIANLNKTKRPYLLKRKIQYNILILIIVFILAIPSYFINEVFLLKIIISLLFTSMVIFLSIIGCIYLIFKHVENNKD